VDSLRILAHEGDWVSSVLIKPGAQRKADTLIIGPRSVVQILPRGMRFAFRALPEGAIIRVEMVQHFDDGTRYLAVADGTTFEFARVNPGTPLRLSPSTVLTSMRAERLQR
jgi:hypothetical protein